MKKLLILVGAIAASIVANASAFSWKVDDINLPGTTTALSSGTAYIFAASTTGSGAVVSQASLVEAFLAGSLNLSATGAIDSKSFSSGSVAKGLTTFNYGEDGNDNVFYVALVTTVGTDDYLYISPTASKKGVQGKTTATSFDAYDSSSAAAFTTATTYTNAGWYAAPEPTSGLLLLIGMAGLALKRKRA